MTELDTMPDEQAAELFRSCCGSTAWVNGMLSHRPFGTRDVMLNSAEDVFITLTPDDWAEAFAHHPRLGDAKVDAPATEQSREWSAVEQGAVQASSDEEREALAEANRKYEERYGRVCIICANGRSAGAILAITHARMSNTPMIELRVSAGEQRKITRLRLEKLVPEPS
ncbi:MAG: decarboxylase [Gemmatimonadetes bacterium]|nr:decarboxylase [Gemmatimonadota bacterium]